MKKSELNLCRHFKAIYTLSKFRSFLKQTKIIDNYEQQQSHTLDQFSSVIIIQFKKMVPMKIKETTTFHKFLLANNSRNPF
jgi:hypothetical protein